MRGRGDHSPPPLSVALREGRTHLSMPTLTPPTEEQALETHHPLFGRYRLSRGLSLLISGTTVYLSQYPNHQDIIDGLYDYVYLGGYTYDISSDVATILTDAGYGAYIT